MAKESMKAREVKRLKLVERYADPPAQPLQTDRPPERIHANVRHQPYPVPRNGFPGADSRREESELVDIYDYGLKIR